ncbi:MAG: hypothetical protein ACYDHP_02995 [Ferrimicrobium sp.]
MVAENFGDIDGTNEDGTLSAVTAEEMMRLVAEANALESVGVEQVLGLFEGRVQVQQKRRARTTQVTVGSERYVLVQDRDGRTQESRIETVVNGVRIRSETTVLAAWVVRLLGCYQQELGRRQLDRDSLARILGLS